LLIKADALQAAHTEVLFDSDSYFNTLQQERTREREDARQEHEREVERESKRHRQDLQKNKGKMKALLERLEEVYRQVSTADGAIRKTLSCDASLAGLCSLLYTHSLLSLVRQYLLQGYTHTHTHTHTHTYKDIKIY
jgi:hypothetical protein